MTRQQAVAAAKKRWPLKAHIQAYDSVSSPEKRAVAAAEMAAARSRREAINAEVAARLKELDWYQALMAERRTATETLREAGRAVYYKFSVGEVLGIGFHVYGQGDTCGEAFAKADERAARERQRRAANG